MTAPSIATRIDRRKHDDMVRLLAGGPEERHRVLDMAADLLGLHIKDRLAAGAVSAFDGLPNRRINEIHDWNQMFGAAEASREQAVGIVARRWAHSLIVYPLFRTVWNIQYGKAEGDAALEEGYSAFIAEVDVGDIPSYRSGMGAHDHVTGETLDLEMQGWRIAVGERRTGLIHFVPAADAQAPGIRTLDIDLPSGDLAIGDWFRAEGFTDLVDEGVPWRGGSRHENEAETQRYAASFGFVAVATSMRSLTVLRKGGRVSVGSLDGEAKPPVGYDEVCRMVVDLRMVSMIDAVVLRGILARIHPHDVAARLAEETMAAAAIRIRVKPGRYRLSYTGDSILGALLDPKDPLLESDNSPILILDALDDI